MVKAVVPKGVPKDDDFMQKYGGGTQQHGSKGASPISDQNAEEFQRHMQSLEAKNAQVPKISPHDLMSPKGTQNLGAPTMDPLKAPAPENFGPPQISKVDTGNKLNFGAPGSHSFKNVPQNFGPPKGTGDAAASKPPTNLAGADQASTEKQAHPGQVGATKGKGGGSLGATKGKPPPKETFKHVENLEVDNMLQNAMNHMKISDPDPDAWN